MAAVNPDFIAGLTESVGRENAAVFLAALDTPPSVSIRYNPYKLVEVMEGEPVPWSGWGRMLAERPSFTLDPKFHAGAIYVQDSSAMYVGHAFRKILSQVADSQGEDGPIIRVLDLCAAPGGKTTDLAASLRETFGNRFILVANEVMKQRAAILCDNVARWGDPNIVVTSVDPAAFARYAGFFDIIVADVPCSGEGMFRKDEEALRQWSADNVTLCAARQKRIVSDVWQALAQGGVLVYSTCTFNLDENDRNVGWIAAELGAQVIDTQCDNSEVIKTGTGCLLLPGRVPGEGQFCAALQKTASAGRMDWRAMQTRKFVAVDRKTAERLRPMLEEDAVLNIKGDTIVAVPEAIAMGVEMLGQLRPLMSGTALGQIKGKDFVPHADLALGMMLSHDAFPRVDVSRESALHFLHRDPITLEDAPLGMVLVCFDGLPLGFVKNLGRRCNSLLPKDRRILMDITY